MLQPFFRAYDDFRETRKLEKLRKIAKEYDAKVVWGHDPVTWQDWKKAPMFYYD